MHVHELNPKRTTITLILFTLIIVVGLLTIRSPKLKYELTAQESLDAVLYNEAYMYPYELEDIFNGSNDSTLLFDTRNTFEYGRGHIPGAENVSVVGLLENDQVRRLMELKEQGITIVIYGSDQISVNGPWMVLMQLGFDNVKVLLGGYNYYRQWQDNLGDSYMDDSYILGFARHDYSEVAESAANIIIEESSEKPAINITRKKKATVAEGGC